MREEAKLLCMYFLRTFELFRVCHIQMKGQCQETGWDWAHRVEKYRLPLVTLRGLESPHHCPLSRLVWDTGLLCCSGGTALWGLIDPLPKRLPYQSVRTRS